MGVCWCRTRSHGTRSRSVPARRHRSHKDRLCRAAHAGPAGPFGTVRKRRTFDAPTSTRPGHRPGRRGHAACCVRRRGFADPGGATPPPPEAGSLTVLSLWGGSERANFLAVMDGFTAKTGIAVQYETARDFLPVMRTRLAVGNPPMIAIIPRPGVMVDFAKEGYLVDLATLGITNMSANYSQAWLDLGTAEGTLYGVAVQD